MSWMSGDAVLIALERPADLGGGVGLGVEQVDLARRAEVEDHDDRPLVVPLGDLAHRLEVHQCDRLKPIAPSTPAWRKSRRVRRRSRVVLRCDPVPPLTRARLITGLQPVVPCEAPVCETLIRSSPRHIDRLPGTRRPVSSYRARSGTTFDAAQPPAGRGRQPRRGADPHARRAGLGQDQDAHRAHRPAHPQGRRPGVDPLPHVHQQGPRRDAPAHRRRPRRARRTRSSSATSTACAASSSAGWARRSATPTG